MVLLVGTVSGASDTVSQKNLKSGEGRAAPLIHGHRCACGSAGTRILDLEFSVCDLQKPPACHLSNYTEWTSVLTGFFLCFWVSRNPLGFFITEKALSCQNLKPVSPEGEPSRPL